MKGLNRNSLGYCNFLLIYKELRTNEKVANLENAVKRNLLDMAEMPNNIRDLTETKQLIEQDMNTVKENLA